tara:strand:+ start:26400 stop:26678 length:279 start_codon:yes stop_codon:yes gene_type:complete
MSKFHQDDTDRTWPSGLNTPADNAAAIVPHASTDMTNWCRGIYVGVAGNIAVVTVNDQVVNFLGATAGSVIPICAKRVNAVNTTATDLVAIW